MNADLIPTSPITELSTYLYNHINTRYKTALEKDFLIYQSFRDDVVAINYNLDIPNRPRKKDQRLVGTNFFVHIRSSALVEPHARPMIINVCPKSDWHGNWRKTADDYKAIRRYCTKNNFGFAIYDESRIQHQALSNIKHLMYYTAPFGLPSDASAILLQVEMMGITTIEYLLTRFFNGDLLRPYGEQLIMHLIATKRLGIDVWGDLNEKSEVWYV